MSDTTTPSGGAGQQNPFTSNDDFNVACFIVEQMMMRMATMRLVQVKAVHSDGEVAAAGTVDVLPLVNQIDGDGNPTPHGTVYGVPWYRLQGGKNAVIVDPVVDDIGYVDVSDRDISGVKATRARSNPGSFRTFDLADGVYVGGCLNAAPESYLLINDDKVKLADSRGNSILMDADGVTVTDMFGHVLKMLSTGFELTGSVAVTGTITATGNVTAGFGGSFVTLLLHTHAANNAPPTPGH